MPIAILAVFAGLYYWYPKMFGRHMNEFWGKVHFWGTAIPFNLIFIPLFILGAGGQHRRISNFQNFPELNTEFFNSMRVFATMSLVVMLLCQIPFLINFVWSMFKGKKAEANPYKANTLEWQCPSPPPHGNFGDNMPEVYRGPYEFSHPDHNEDYWPQNQKA